MESSESSSDSASEKLSSDASSGPTSPEPRPLVEKKKGGRTRALIVGLVAIIVILAAALGIVVLKPFGPTPAPVILGPLSIQSVAPTGVAGEPITFSIQNLRSDAVAKVSMGDGFEIQSRNATFSYTYTTPGTYLVRIREYGASNNTLIADASTSLLKVYVSPAPTPPSLIGYASIPVIAFNTTKNPNAPITTPNTPFYLYGGYTEISQLFSSTQSGTDNATGVNWTLTTYVTVASYTWDFGNGQTMTLAANTSVAPTAPTYLLPITNPVTSTFAKAGLYTTTLTLFTVENETLDLQNIANGTTSSTTKTIASFSSSLATTIAVGSNFGFLKPYGPVPSPGVVYEAINSPGGPFSFDPQIDYETVGFEVVVNTMATLLIYNGSSTTQWIPFLASAIPTTTNGGITNNNKTYTFHLRSDVGFSNGDPITAYDVWYSMIRAMLFQGGGPGDADWIISQYLLPKSTFVPFVKFMTDPNNLTEFTDVMNGVSYDNATNNVTFHLVRSTPATLFFTAICDALGTGIMDAKWLQSIGEGITFTPHGFYDYQNKSFEGNYNLQTQFGPVSSGPFEINTYVPATSVVLTPNPHFPGVPGIPAQNKTVILTWVASPAIAYQLFASGQADIATLLPPPYYKTINQFLVPANKAVIKGPFPTITELFFVFNLDINTTLLASIGSGYNIPSDYFANIYVREAFAYTLNYTNYIDNVLGNKRYGFTFGNSYCGVIVNGLPYYVPPSTLGNCPSYDLAKAKSLLYQSGLYNTTVNFPIYIPTGITTDYQAALIWAAALNSIDSHITASPVYLDFHSIIGYQSNGTNPMPLFSLGWIADYPYPSDYTDAMYLGNGTYPFAEGWYWWYFDREAAAYPAMASMFQSQAQNYTLLNNLITAADAETNATRAAALYVAAERVAVSLYMYVYTYQQEGFWIVQPYVSPYNNNWGFQENPTIGAGADSVFWWWTKG